METRLSPMPRGAPRAFTLVELMVGSVIAFILVAAAAELASAMARSVRKIETQADLGVRMAIAHGYLQNELQPMAYNWNVTQATASGDTGSFGAGNCASSTGMCALDNGNFFPVRICKSSTVASSVCDAPVSTEADALMTFMPRDTLIEAVVVQAMSDGSLIPADSTACGTFATSPVQLQVTGKTGTAWDVGDYILVSKANHASIGRVNATFSANSSATTARTLALDLGSTSTTTGLALDDGGRTACSPRDSLLGASVIRIRQMVLKLDEDANSATFRNLLLGTRVNSSGSLTFSPLVSNVDDIQFRLDFAKIIASNKAVSFCTDDTTALWSGAQITSCEIALNGEADAAAGRDVLRVAGMRVALVMSSSTGTEARTLSVPYQFDRTGPARSDKTLRRVVNLYLGFPNAIR